MKYYCNPINVPYRYQFNKDLRANGEVQIAREAADPSMILFQGKYYIFVSMNLSVWVSDDMVNWETHRLPENLPLYDYAPDARVCGDFVYFCSSKKGEVCNYYRTKDIIRGPYEEIKGTFDFWDPHLFFDEDGSVYFYWGCSNITPIWGVELDWNTMLPKTERIELLSGVPYEHGYERIGVDNSEFPNSEEEAEKMLQEFLKQRGITKEQLPAQYLPQIKGMFTKMPYIEGPWMDKHKGIYYLQYACPGTEYNAYADGVYTSASPLGPFTLARNNPFSYHPGGFMPGAGHGSTMRDTKGDMWHASTMRISVNHQFERRVGIWPSGYDEDNELFCNQNYGDWPIAVDLEKNQPWREPQWYLLSYVKPASASSSAEGKDANLAVNEDAKNWWKAADKTSGSWLEVDLEEEMDVRAIQINFADDKITIAVPGEINGNTTQPRYIEERDLKTRWKLEASIDGKNYFMLEDKSEADTDLPHDFIVKEEGVLARYVRLTIVEVPYEAVPCISGLRIFGIGNGVVPQKPKFTVNRGNDGLDLLVSIAGKEDAVGYNILWGHEENKLYHSYQIYRDAMDVKKRQDAVISKRIGALVKQQDYFVRVDSYNENGICKGSVVKL